MSITCCLLTLLLWMLLEDDEASTASTQQNAGNWGAAMLQGAVCHMPLLSTNPLHL
jgi:hypothetical protein